MIATTTATTIAATNKAKDKDKSTTTSSSPFTYADLILPLAASYLSTFIVAYARKFTDYVFLLTLIVVDIYAIVKAVHVIFHYFYLQNDGKIDHVEHVYLSMFQFVLWFLGIMIPQFLFSFFSDAFTAWTLPLWYEAVADAVVLLFIVMCMSAFFVKMLDRTRFGNVLST